MIGNSEKCPKCGHDLTAVRNVKDPHQLAAEIMPHLRRMFEESQLSASSSSLAGSGSPQSLRSIPAHSVIAEEVNCSDSGTQNAKTPQQLINIGFANRPVHAFPPESRFRVIARSVALYPLDTVISWLKIVLGMLRQLRNAVFRAFRVWNR